MATTTRTRASKRTAPSTVALADDILRSLRRILRKISEHSRQLANAGNLTVPQLLCLRAIANMPKDDPPTLAVIAEQIQLSTATVSRILERLEQRGLLVRRRSTVDRRKIFVTLSASGKRQISQMPTPLHEEFWGRLMRLKKSEQKQLLQALETIVEMMGASDLDAAPLLSSESMAKPSK